jgi:hypothetical protein
MYFLINKELYRCDDDSGNGVSMLRHHCHFSLHIDKRGILLWVRF